MAIISEYQRCPILPSVHGLQSRGVALKRVPEKFEHRPPDRPERKTTKAEKLDAIFARIQAKLEKDYPGYSNTYFVETGLHEVWE